MRPVLFAFDSEDSVNIHYSSESESVISSPTMSQPESILSQTLLLPMSGRKPPQPPLPRPLNVTAYTRPSHYGPYIDSVLPPTLNVASSSLTTMAETETLTIIREENGHQFSDLIAKEMNRLRPNAPESWISNVLFIDATPHNFRQRFRSSSAWNATDERFQSMPQSLTEENMQVWLNSIVDSLATTFGLVQRGPNGESSPPSFDRTWNCRTANSSPTGGTRSRKPDLSLFDRTTSSAFKGKENKSGWAVIQAIAEITQSTNAFSNVVKTIIEKAYLIFKSQPYRRYVIALGFFGQPESAMWALVLVDRAGVISSSQFPLKGAGGITLAQVLYCLSFAEPRYIGIDDTMTISKLTGIVTHITVTGQTPTSEEEKPVTRIFEVIRLLHSTSQVFGRATHVWLVRRKGHYYVLKDSWPPDSKPFSEIRHLLKINQTIMNDKEMHNTLEHTYPVLVVGQELGDSTNLRRLELPDKHNPRVHRRVVTKPVGDPLTSFRSKYELCSVLCDVVTFLQYSAEKCQVCHGDVSLNNIVINRIWDDNNDNNEIDDDIDDTDIESISSNNVALNVTINENSASKITGPGQVYITGISSNSELTSSIDSPTLLSSSAPGPVPIEAHGLLIDHDNSFSLTEIDEFGYWVNTETLPFMALDALKWNVASEFKHQPKHDLESLFYVIITLCTYVNEPGHLRTSIPATNELSVCLNEWWATRDLHILARQKGVQLSSFDMYILQRLPPYWNDFHQVLKDLHAVLWIEEYSVLRQPNVATHEAFLEVLIKAQEMYRQQEEEAYSFAPIIKKQGDQNGLQKRERSGGDVSKDANRKKKRTY